MDKIKVVAILPTNAHLNIPKNTPEKVISTHVDTPRGCLNAYKKALYIHHEYTVSHGNSAAHMIQIVTDKNHYWTMDEFASFLGFPDL